MEKTLVVLNPNAADGKVRDIWPKLHTALEKHFPDLDPHFTESPAEVEPVVRTAYEAGIRRVLSVGGDGTNHSVVDAVIRVQNDHLDEGQMVYGSLPVGTGRDWNRSLGMPLELFPAVDFLGQVPARKIDVVEFTADDGDPEIFLNVGDIGLGGCVAGAVNALPKRYPWSFMWQSVRCILNNELIDVTIEADGETFYEGETFITAIANGAVFGHGMRIAPRAELSDGKIDLLTIGRVGRAELLTIFPRVYLGTHPEHHKVIYKQVETIRIISRAGAIALELDGETRVGQRMDFRVLPARLTILG